MLTSGISAEYGRFSRRRRQHRHQARRQPFLGQLPRRTCSNPSWTDETPFETTRAAGRSAERRYEGTLGGPILRDRVVVLRRRPLARTRPRRRTTSPQTGIPATAGVDNKRYERQGARPRRARNHTFQGSFHRQQHGADERPRPRRVAIEPRVLVTRQLPQQAVRRQLERRAVARSCSPRRSARRSTSGSGTPAAPAPTSTTRRSAPAA